MSFGFSAPLRVRLLLTLLLAAAPGTASAQFGSIAKKVKDKVAPLSGTTTTTNTPSPGANDCIKCAAKNMAITPDLVSRLLTGLKAELAERDREEKQHASDGVGQLYAARDYVLHCDTLKATDSAQQSAIIKRAQTGDRQAVKDIQAMAARLGDAEHQKCSTNKAPEEHEQSFFNMLNSVQAHQDTVGAQAAGFSVVDFEAAVELVSTYVLAYDPKSAASHFPPSAVSAMDAQRAALAALMKREFNPGGQHKVSSEL